MHWTWIVFALVAVGYVTPEVIQDDGDKRGLTHIDVMLSALTSQTWDTEEAPCVDTLINTLTEAKNDTLWAVWVVDSIQFPIGQLFGTSSHMGNYDECLSPHLGFEVADHVPRYKYCMNLLMLTDKVEDRYFVERNPDAKVDTYLNKKTRLYNTIAKSHWGLCVPAVCEPHSVTKIARAFLKISHLASLEDKTSIEIEYCTSGEPEKYSLGYYIFLTFVVAFIIASIGFTYGLSAQIFSPDSFLGELARSFCLRRNGNELTKIRDDEIFPLNGMRVVTSLLIVGSHMISINMQQGLVNALKAEEILLPPSKFMLHIDLNTDTFFAISGLLFMRGLFTDKYKSPLKYIWKRYIRLTAALAVITAYTALVVQYNDHGTLWSNFPHGNVQACKTKWWHNFLMIANIIDITPMCLMMAWYVPCDYQLSILTTILFCIYQRSKRGGIRFISIITAIGITHSVLINYWKNLKPVPYGGMDLLPDDNKAIMDVYIHPLPRIPTFMVGAVLGYIMHTYKPKDYRKYIPKFWSYIGLATAMCTMLLCLYGGYYFYFVSPDVSPQSLAFGALNRGLWAAGIATIVAVCEYGDIPFLQKAMRWSPLVSLSRLTYTAYLIQEPLQMIYVGTLRSLVHFDDFHNNLITVGMMVMCYAGSLFIWLFIEAPILNVNTMLTYKTWGKKRAEAVDGKNK